MSLIVLLLCVFKYLKIRFIILFVADLCLMCFYKIHNSAINEH